PGLHSTVGGGRTRALRAARPGSIIISRATAWSAGGWPGAAPTGAWRRAWAAARAMRSRPASTAPRDGVQPISPRPWPSPTHWMSTDRFAFAGDHLTANFNAQSFGGRVEGGYRFATIYGGLTPHAAIQAQSFHTPGYTEADPHAGGVALGFTSRTATENPAALC